jgi:hypothetical protein
MKVFFLFLATATVYCSAAFAGDCVLSIERTACPGKETEALKPYSGKNPTEEKKDKANSEADCSAEAEKAAKIIRKGTLSKKVVSAKFGGKEIGKKEDSSACK